MPFGAPYSGLFECMKSLVSLGRGLSGRTVVQLPRYMLITTNNFGKHSKNKIILLWALLCSLGEDCRLPSASSSDDSASTSCWLSCRSSVREDGVETIKSGVETTKGARQCSAGPRRGRGLCIGEAWASSGVAILSGMETLLSSTLWSSWLSA